MKKKLPLLSFLMLLLAIVPKGNAQTTVTVDGDAVWTGYANVFDNGTYLFGSAWDIPALKSVVNPGVDTVELYPNFNTYDASDPFWSNGELGNKTFEGNTFVENPALAGQTLTFTGTVSSNTFAAGYEVLAFIKGLNPLNGYSLDVYVHTPLISGNTFTITAADIPSGLIVQYGFSVTGLNGNPAHAAELGSATVGAAVLKVNEFDIAAFSVFPNPVSDLLTIQSGKNLEMVSICNLLGQRIIAQNPNALSANVNVSDLPAGMYVVNATSEGKTSAVKIIKK